MSRAALLPLPGDPFLFHYWMQLFHNVWGKEVDKLYVYHNSSVEKPVADYIAELCNSPNIYFRYKNAQVDHGDCLNELLDEVTEEHVMLVEDDGFIFKPGAVDEAFKKLESGDYDIVGSKRGSCAQQILDKAQELWGISYEGEGDQGCNFWPCYFFSSKQLLLKTDRHFKAKAWYRGDLIKPLKYVVEDEVLYGDTFVNTSLQLREMVRETRICYLPQYHTHPDDQLHHMQGKSLWNHQARWCHIGSLSSGIGGILMDDQSRALSRREIEEAKGETKIPRWGNMGNDSERKEWERRVQMWLTFYEKRDKEAIPEFAELYYRAIFRVISQYNLNLGRIRQRQSIYNLVGL